MNTNTGRSPRLKPYYLYLEKRFFAALSTMVYKNLELYLARLRGDAPVFVVNAVLSAAEVVTSPPVKEIYKLLTQSVRKTVESVRRFVRWMYGTCIECAPQHVEGRDEPYVFSFQKDIQVHPRFLDVVSQLNMTITQFLGGLNKYLTRWRNKCSGDCRGNYFGEDRREEVELREV